MVKAFLLLLLYFIYLLNMKLRIFKISFMIKYIIIFIAAIPFPVMAAPNLSAMAEISLLTCSSGPELYKTFGHSAIRVKDPLLNIDRVYNYGTFDFNTENFYLKFAQGKLNYWLSVSSFENFFFEYAYYKQTVFENEFNLTPPEKQRLFDFLENNYLPENRFYLYDFFFDNCATRIRDAIYSTFNGEVAIADTSWHKEITFREGLDLYMTNQPWTHLGMDLGLGTPTDRKMNSSEIMFLPEYLMLGLESMVMTTETGEKPLLRQRLVLYEGSAFGTDASEFNYLFVILLLIAIAVMYATYQEMQKGVHNYKFDNLVFIVPAIIAVVQLVLWFATDHKTTKINPDLLWSFPPLVLLLIKKNKAISSPAFRNGLLLAMLMAAIYLILWFVFRINFNLMILPLVLLGLARIVKLYFVAVEQQKIKHEKISS
jgi:hypothetical protein